MFTNRNAIRTLVLADTRASEAEKESVLLIIEGRKTEEPKDDLRMVVSFSDAARMLGMRSKASVYRAVRDGSLDGFYSGANKSRATGVTMSSIRRLIESSRAVDRRVEPSRFARTDDANQMGEFGRGKG